jgi:hypothetical protein
MDADRILATLNRCGVAYLLIGGVNFLLRHSPVVTFDVDVWVEDVPENLARMERALAELQAEWGPSETDWTPVADRAPGWLQAQSVFCLTSPHGAIDVFRAVRGLDSWAASRSRAEFRHTATGVGYPGLADDDMLRCQTALPESERKLDRIRTLRRALGLEDG